MTDRLENKVNLILQIVMQILDSTTLENKKKLKELMDDYGYWKDSKEFRSGEKR